MKICMISDTHEMHARVKLPQCDLLIHAGDITGRGSLEKLKSFNDWIADNMEAGIVKEAICIAGNHDLSLETNRERAEAMLPDITYLNNQLHVTRDGLEVYGIPEQLFFNNWAFNTTEVGMKEKLDDVPEGIDVLVTHGPPYGVLDHNRDYYNCGSVALREWIIKAQPRLVVCGHIHEDYGLAQIGKTLIVNASTCNGAYSPVNPPVVLDLQMC